MENKMKGKQGKDISMKIKLSFLEAIHGCTKEVRYSVGNSSEKTRRGKYKPPSESKIKVVDVKIPPGIDTVRNTVLNLSFVFFEIFVY